MHEQLARNHLRIQMIFKREIKSYMTYYNHYLGRWNLKKLPPAKYRQQLQQIA
uniref:IS3 family transposase n=1 Tax=Metasolibacillus sp. FSL H7-0170 TaxID=2921431 RepID=UPI00406C7B03